MINNYDKPSYSICQGLLGYILIFEPIVKNKDGESKGAVDYGPANAGSLVQNLLTHKATTIPVTSVFYGLIRANGRIAAVIATLSFAFLIYLYPYSREWWNSC